MCWRWCGTKIHMHHIVPRASGGPDTIVNAIPVCLDCHAEIESRSNMGRQFTQAELREHKRRWLEICRDQPAALIQTNRATGTGPIESLLAELEFNSILITGDDHRNDFATLAVTQFERAIAANALSSLDTTLRERVYRNYKLITETSDLIRSRAGHGPGGNSYNLISNQIAEKRRMLRVQLPETLETLRRALGGGDAA